MSALIEAVRAGADPDDLLNSPVPDRYTAAFLSRADENIFGDSPDRDVRRTIHVGEVPMPELAPNEVLVAVMASAVNYNTIWSAMFQPISTFRFLRQLARHDPWGGRHDIDQHVVGSDAAGIVVRVGAGVRHWKVGDHVVVAPPYIDEQEPIAQQDGMLSANMLAWGFETNFGAFGEFAVARATQLVPKPAHLSWEEAACNTLCLGTAYRMLISPNGARIKVGDVVLIWGATGGLGAYAVQLVRQAGGIPIGVVSSPTKADLAERLGCRAVLSRVDLGIGDDEPDGPNAVDSWRALGDQIRKRVGEDPHVAFDYIGRKTFGASIYTVRRGGVVVTCGSSSGYVHQYDNRYLWMKIKRIVGSHGANYQESWEANRLLSLGLIIPTLSRVYPLCEVAAAARVVQLNQHAGKIGVLGIAQREGMGVDDPGLREQIGESRLRLFRDAAMAEPDQVPMGSSSTASLGGR